MDAQSARDAVLAAFPQALIRHKARQLSRQRGFVANEEDDLRQELTARVLSKLHRFDADRGALDAFFRCVVESAAGITAAPFSPKVSESLRDFFHRVMRGLGSEEGVRQISNFGSQAMLIRSRR